MSAGVRTQVEAQADFRAARSRARGSIFSSIFRKEDDMLLSFAEVKSTLRPTGESYVGCKSIPVDRVVGSEGRCTDFSRRFMPRCDYMGERWMRVDTAYLQSICLPPVKVLEMGGVYFVRDGNHRISVARLHKVAFIDAEVIRFSGGVPLEPGMTMADIEGRARSREYPGTAA